MKKYKFFWMISLSSLFFILLCSGAWANSWDDLVRFYDLDKRMTYEAHILRQKLLQEACNISSEELWRSLRQNLTPRQKAAKSLLLIERLCSGNLQNWEEVEGFWYPGLMPKPLALIEGFYFSLWSLSELPDEASPWLAFTLIKDLRSSSRGKLYFLEMAPHEYGVILKQLKARGVPLPDNWFDFEERGSLPLIRSFRGRIGYDSVLLKNMVFLNNAGQPSSNGYYAWDRDRGYVYQVSTSSRRRIFIIWD
jgi:hypothetical protein